VRFLVLDRYIARELVSPFAFGCMLFTFFLVIDGSTTWRTSSSRRACPSISSPSFSSSCSRRSGSHAAHGAPGRGAPASGSL